MVSSWAFLSELNSASDHEYIITTSASNTGTSIKRREAQDGWSVKKLSMEAISRHWKTEGLPPALPPDVTAEDHAAHLQGFLTKTCDAAMPRRTTFNGR